MDGTQVLNTERSHNHTPDCWENEGTVEEFQTCPDGDVESTSIREVGEKSLHSSQTYASQYYGGWGLIAVTMGIMALVLMVALDNYILATAVPRISTEFKDLDSVGWYASAYFLTQTAFQPSLGYLFSKLSIKYLSLSAMVIFEVGSVVSATARSSASLIVGRLISGAGGAGLYITVLAMLPCIVPLARRPLYLSLVTTMFGVASIAGPLLGGVFTDSSVLTWRFCFWINLPIGFFAVLLIGFSFHDPPKHEVTSLDKKTVVVDVISVIVFLASFVCFLFAMQWGGYRFPWSNVHVWGCLIGFGLLLAIYIGIQLFTGAHASVPLHVITQRTVAASCASILCTSMCVGVLIYYLPFYFQAVWDRDARGSALDNLPFLVTMLFTPILSGALISLVVGYCAPFMWLGGIFTAIGSGLLYSVHPTSSRGQLDGFQFLAGFGLGLCTQVPFSAVQAVLPPTSVVLGSSLVSFCNSLGPVLGSAIAQAIFVNRLKYALRDVPGVDVTSMAQLGLAHPTVQSSVQVRDAFDEALTRAFLVPVVCGSIAFACSLGVQWINIKHKS